MRLMLAISFAVIVAVYVIQLVGSYRALAPTAGTWQAHLWAAAEGSATKLWAKFIGIVSAVLGYLATATDLLNSPQITEAIQKISPEYAAIVIAGLFLLTSFVTEWARGRTLPAKD